MNKSFKNKKKKLQHISEFQLAKRIIHTHDIEKNFQFRNGFGLKLPSI